MQLTDHPRLLIGPHELARLAEPPRRELLRMASAALDTAADEALEGPVFDYPRKSHNALLQRARKMQTRVISLLTRWKRDGDDRDRAAVIEHVEEMDCWECWSWIAMRAGDTRNEAIFDLSYGENSATLALAYDLLFDTLDARRRAWFHDVAARRSLRPFLVRASREPVSWWLDHPSSNWNTVCAGGAGMLATAMAEDLPEAPEVIERVERSFDPYMKSLDTTDGGWPEGIGYWNYGMRYAFMYLLSRERATGRPHPLMESPAVPRTLRFPLDFCPNGVACSFGDVNGWTPLPFHYAAAERLGCEDVLAALDHHLAGQDRIPGGWAAPAELLLMHPRREPADEAESRDVARIYHGIDWALLADRMPSPGLYASIRGGSTKVPHAHLDLLSFHCVAGDEAMIVSQAPRGYLDSTFSARRWDLYGMAPDSKNGILINGVGIEAGSSVLTTPIQVGEATGFRLDATQAMGSHREAGPVAAFCGRAFLLLPGPALLIVDETDLRFPGLVESRMHTFADVEAGDRSAVLTGQRQRLRVSLACDREARFLVAGSAPVHPVPGPSVLRWCLPRPDDGARTACLLTAGDAPTSVDLSGNEEKTVVRAACAGRELTLEFGRHLTV